MTKLTIALLLIVIAGLLINVTQAQTDDSTIPPVCATVTPKPTKTPTPQGTPTATATPRIGEAETWEPDIYLPMIEGIR